MRLWPVSFIGYLPRQQLLGQHRECCALRGKGWGRKHKTVDFVFRHPYYWLYLYHRLVIEEMEIRGYIPEYNWRNYYGYRGKSIGFDHSDFTQPTPLLPNMVGWIYPEFDKDYVEECLDNLLEKGIDIRTEMLHQIQYEQGLDVVPGLVIERVFYERGRTNREPEDTNPVL